jgi:hypothetical protein
MSWLNLVLGSMGSATRIKTKYRLDMMVHSCISSYLGGRKIVSWRSTWAKSVRPCLKNKRAVTIAQVAEHLPSNLDILGFIPTTEEKEKKTPCIFRIQVCSRKQVCLSRPLTWSALWEALQFLAPP